MELTQNKPVKHVFSFPPEREMQRVLKRFADPHYKRVNIGLMTNASELDKAKYDICQSISRYKRMNNFTPAKLARKIGISQAKTDDILFGRINELNFEELASYAEKLNGHLQVKVSYERETASAGAN
jgi:predicted XRE-type DNA-binding protein